MKYIFINHQGSAMLMTILIMTSVLTVSMGIANIVLPGVLMARTQTRSTKAYYAAETGIERLLWATRTGAFDPNNCDLANGKKYVSFEDNMCLGVLSVNPGTGNRYLLNTNNTSYYIEMTASSSPTVFRAVGSYLGTNRVIEASY